MGEERKKERTQEGIKSIKFNGKEEGLCGVRGVAAGRLRSGEPIQGPGGDVGDEGTHREREMDPNREGQNHKGEASLVLSHRRC